MQPVHGPACLMTLTAPSWRRMKFWCLGSMRSFSHGIRPMKKAPQIHRSTHPNVSSSFQGVSSAEFQSQSAIRLPAEPGALLPLGPEGQPTPCVWSTSPRTRTSKVTGGMSERRWGDSGPSCSKALTCGQKCVGPQVGR